MGACPVSCSASDGEHCLTCKAGTSQRASQSDSSQEHISLPCSDLLHLASLHFFSLFWTCSHLLSDESWRSSYWYLVSPQAKSSISSSIRFKFGQHRGSNENTNKKPSRMFPRRRVKSLLVFSASLFLSGVHAQVYTYSDGSISTVYTVTQGQ